MRNRTIRHSWRGVTLIVVLALAAVLLTPVARSVEVAELYSAQVPLDPRDPDGRNDAYRSALNLVLVRITGDRYAAESPLLAELFSDPSRYVLQYRPGDDNSLWVSLDGAAIENVLRRAGQTVWGNNRPLTLIWLAVDWGQGEREIIGADDAERSPALQRSIDRNRQLRNRMQDAALGRGLPISFPLLDTEDLGSISFSDLWGGFDQLVLQASERYGADAVLIGRVRPAAAQPYRWTYHMGNETFEYSGDPVSVVDQMADSLLAEFAVAGNVPLETVSLTVTGIDSLAAYGAVQRLMGELTPVESFAIDNVTGDRVRYLVHVYGGAERLSRALQLNGSFKPESGLGRPLDASRMPQFDALEFSYRP